MKPWSKKRRIRWSQVESWRNRFKERVSRCEMCLKASDPLYLDVHECVTGSLRQHALDKEWAVLALHRRCHTIMETLTIPHQLAYLLRARPDEFHLEAYHKLTGRKWPSVEQILLFWENLP